MDSPHYEHFRQLMREHGITETHGVELMGLIKLVANAYESTMAERMRSERLSAPRWRLLVRLFMEERQGNTAISPTWLSHSQSLSRNTISAHLRSLEEQGLVERELDSNDLRQFRIRLTDAGRDLIRSSTPGHMQFLNALVADLSDQEKEQLQLLLRQLHRSMTRHAQPPEVGDKG